jgi:hypothetical protein
MNELPKFESGPEKEGAVEQVEGKKEARQEFDEVSVSDKKEKNPATPEVTREEAFNLYKESIYLFNEFKMLAGLEEIPTDQKSLESWFNKGLENSRGNLSVYVSSTKERIADIKKQIEDLKRKGAGPDREITKDKGGELALGIGSESSPKIDTVGAGAKDGVEGSEVVGSFGLSEKVESSQGAGVDMSGSKIEDQNKEKELEGKKREAYGFYIEFVTLLAELNEMSGDPKIATDQKSLDDSFDNDVQGLDEGDWDGYISDLKKRIADIQTQIEINKRNLIDERKRKKVGVGGGDDVTVKLDESLDIGEINTDLENQRSLEEAVRPKNDHAKEEAEILNAQLKRELDSLLNRLNRVKNIRFVNKDGEEGQMSSSWEVKEPVGGKIRAGIEGTTASIKMRTEIDNVVNIIVNAYSGSRTKQGFKSLFRKQQLDLIRHFIVNEVPMIRKAEISGGRMMLMLDVLNLINQAIYGNNALDSTENSIENDEQKFVELGDEKKTVKKDIDTATFVKIGQELGLPNEELNITEKDIFKSIFSNMAFTDPDKWFKMYWTKGASASDVFGHCTGVILVSEDGYKVVNHNRLNREIVFFSISQSRTQFKVS